MAKPLMFRSSDGVASHVAPPSSDFIRPPWYTTQTSFDAGSNRTRLPPNSSPPATTRVHDSPALAERKIANFPAATITDAFLGLTAAAAICASSGPVLLQTFTPAARPVACRAV